MRTLLLHLDGIEMWRVTEAFLEDGGDGLDKRRYEIVQTMKHDLSDTQRFSSSTAALAALHALAARDRSIRSERMAMRKRRHAPRGWHALRTFWLPGGPVVAASRGPSRASAVRAMRAQRLADRPRTAPAVRP